MSVSRWQGCWFVLVVTITTIVATAAAAEEKTGLLPVCGSAKRAEQLSASVLTALRKQQREVVSPDKLLARLAANPQVGAALTAAREAITRSEQATLYMKKQRAIAAAKEALEQLDGIAGRHHANTVVARAQLARGVAALLEPPDAKTALAAFRAAFSADPELQPNPDRIPSRTAKMLRRARRRSPAARPPTRQELALLARLSGIDALLWIAIAARSDQLEVIALRYDHDEKVINGPQRSTRPLPGPSSDRLASDVARSLGYVSAAAVVLRAPVAASKPAIVIDQQSPPSDKPTARPWYKRWWVWTIAAGVVAGSAVTIAMVAGSRTERAYTFRFDLK